MARREGLLTHLPCLASSGFTLTIEPLDPQVRSVRVGPERWTR